MKQKREPYPHQQEHFEEHRDDEAYAVFWEMGCVDAQTEYLSPTGWQRIDRYAGPDQVAQWCPETGEISFVHPTRYIARTCSEFIHLKTARGVDQMLSPDHRVFWLSKPHRKLRENTAQEIATAMEGNPSASRVLPATGRMALQGVDTGFSETDLRLLVAVMADGSFPKDAPNTRRVTVRLKKERKKQRLRALLAGREFTERHEPTGFSVFRFESPARMKHYPWWHVSQRDADIILDEVFHWDGAGGNQFFSTCRQDVDFIQFLATMSGRMASIGLDRRTGRKDCWYVRVRNVYENGLYIKESSISRHSGGQCFCFQVPSGGLVLRRNGNVFFTGNCGKSKTTLDTAAWQHLNGKIDTLFIVAPKGVHRNWVTDEIPEHLSPDVEKYRTVLYQSSRAGGVQYSRELEAALAFDGLLIVAMNYDALRTKHGFKYAEKLMKRRTMMVLDESPRIKNPRAVTTKATIKLGRKAVSRRILTGTPITNGPFDAYSQIDFLDSTFWKRLHFGTFTAFKNHYGIYNVEYLSEGRRYNALVGYRNVDSLYEILATISDRKTKETVLDLPPKVYTKRYVELTKPQRRLYDRIREDAIAFLENGDMVSAQIVIVQLLRLQQIACGFVVTEDNETVDIEGGNPRIDALMETLDDCRPQQSIVWARFQHDIDLISQRMREDKVSHVVYDGRTSDRDRAQAIDDFRSGRASVFLANPAAAAEGLTLTEATVVIYYSHSFKLAERLQSEDRAHRIGQDCAVTYVDFVAPDTIDEKIVSALRKKLNIASMITGDSFREWI